MNSQQESKRDSKGLIPAYGGELKELIIKDEELKLKLLSQVSYEHECSDRNACDIELLMVGGFSPLEGFMDKEEYKSVIKSHSCLLYTSPSPRDRTRSRMPSSA